MGKLQESAAENRVCCSVYSTNCVQLILLIPIVTVEIGRMPEADCDLSKCRVCLSVGAKLCSKCKAVGYCGANCQKKDWVRHRANCSPVLVAELKHSGRGLVAARKIKTGELILKENATIALPQDIDAWEAGDIIAKQVEKLNKEQQTEFYKLTYKQGLVNLSEQCS